MDYRRFDLNLLVVLDGLLTEKGVNATARRLGMSQPNVSFALTKLRRELCDVLLVRDGNSMRLTPYAQSLRLPLRRILDDIETDLLGGKAFDPATSSRRFVISTSDIGELVFLPRLMQELAVRAPGVTLECRVLPPAELEAAMASGAVDLAAGYFPDLTGSAFVTQKLFDHPFTCIARRDHPGVRDDWTLADFLALGHIVVAQKGRSQELFEARLIEMGVERRVQLRSPHFVSVPALVAGSDLISTVPKAVGAIYATMADLRLVAPPFETPLISLQQFWHRRVHDDLAIQWLRRLISELFLGRDPSPMHDAAA